MHTDDEQVLAEFMRHVVYPDLDAPDLAVLKAVSDHGLIRFALRLGNALHTPVSTAVNRTEALQSITRLIDEYNTKVIPGSNPQVVTVNPTARHKEQIDNSAVHYQPGQDGERWRLDVTPNITPRVLRHYRENAKWLSASRFFQLQGINVSPNCKWTQVVRRQEEERYATEHPTATPQEIKDYIQKEYIALTTPEDRISQPGLDKHAFRVTWVDLSPRAQEDLKAVINEAKVLKAGEYKQVIRRKGWKALDSCGRQRAWGDRKRLVAFLDMQCAMRKMSYQMTHPKCPMEEVEQSVTDTYLWQYSTGHSTRRVLSPEAQSDVEAFFEENRRYANQASARPFRSRSRRAGM